MDVDRRTILAGAAGLFGSVAGCLGVQSADPGPTPASSGANQAPASGAVALPSIRPSGNRVLAGSGRLDRRSPIDLDHDEPVAWVLGGPAEGGSCWLTVGRSGSTTTFPLVNDEPRIERTGPPLPPGTPPVLVAGSGAPRLLTPPAGASRLSHALLVEGTGTFYVRSDGAVVARTDEQSHVFDVDAPADARIVQATSSRFAVLAGPTDRYPHGALGDEIEAAGIAVIDLDGAPSAERVIELSGPAVIEGTAPIAAAWGDEPLLAVAISDPDGGARVACFDLDGSRVATGPPVGTGYRWRHPLCVAPFGPSGEEELAAVRTPHVGGVAEFYRRDGDELTVAATHAGVSSHAYGSRNLDGGLAADFDGDGLVELLVPTDDRRTLVSLRRTRRGAEEAFRLPVGGRVASNVFGFRDAADRISVGVGRTDGTVRVWGP